MRDAIRSEARGIEAFGVAVHATPPHRIRVEAANRGVAVPIDVCLRVTWLGPDGAPPGTAVDRALLTHATHASRVRVRAEVEARRGGVPLCMPAAAILHVEVPSIVAGPAAPPESGYYVVHGREYVVRCQERFAFGAWLVTGRPGHLAASMRSPPAWPGAICRLTRITPASLAVRIRPRDGRTLPLAAVLVLLGETSAASFAARVGAPPYDAAPLAAVWPASSAEAEAMVRNAVRSRLPPLAGMGGAQPPSVAELLATWVLPHMPVEHKLEALAHGVARMAAGVADDMDHLGHKRMDAAGDMLACALGAQWHSLWAKVPRALNFQRQKWTGVPAVVADELCVAGLEAIRTFVASMTEAAQHAFVSPDWVGADGAKTSGVCEKVTRMNAAAMISLMRCTRSTLGGPPTHHVNIVHPERRGGFAPPAPPDSCGGLGHRNYVPNCTGTARRLHHPMADP